jgi:hypothetical protein
MCSTCKLERPATQTALVQNSDYWGVGRLHSCLLLTVRIHFKKAQANFGTRNRTHTSQKPCGTS